MSENNIIIKIDGIIEVKAIHLSRNPTKGGTPDREKTKTEVYIIILYLIWLNRYK